MVNVVLFLALLIALCHGQSVSVTSDEGKALKALYDESGGFGWLFREGWLVNTNVCTWVGVTCALVSGKYHVTEVNLANNNMKGPLPSSIGDLKYLTKLLLQENRLSGAIPSSISQMTRLELLLLYKNEFTSLPTISQNTITHFYVEENQIKGAFPAYVTNLRGAIAIDLSKNQFTGSLPEEWQNAANLKDFRANDNDLTGSLPPEMFQARRTSGGAVSSVQLQTIQLSDNDLEGAIPSIGTHTKILYLDGNKLSCFAPDTSGVDARLDGNSFLCERLGTSNSGVRCTNPVVASFSPAEVEVPDSMELWPTVNLEITLDDASSISSCEDIYCYLGALKGTRAIRQGSTNKVRCNIESDGTTKSVSVSLRDGEGNVISRHGASFFKFKQQPCGDGDCSMGQGECKDNGDGPKCECFTDIDGKQWTGSTCSRKVCPQNCNVDLNDDKKKENTCNGLTGECDCHEDYIGEACQTPYIKCPLLGGLFCGGPTRGFCNFNTGDCVCGQEYKGERCEEKRCPYGRILNTDEFTECSSRGSCVDGECICGPKNEGSSCSGRKCNQICGSGMSCILTNPEDIESVEGTCECRPGFTDDPTNPECAGCSCQRCPSIDDQVCSGHGTCVYDENKLGSCVCDELGEGKSWRAGDCGEEQKLCPTGLDGKECSGLDHGECDRVIGECICHRNIAFAYKGTACELPDCDLSVNQCTGVQDGNPIPTENFVLRGECGEDGKCKCFDGWGGKDCMTKPCPKNSQQSECGEAQGLGTCDGVLGICKCEEGKGLDPKTGCEFLLCEASNNVFDCGSSVSFADAYGGEESPVRCKADGSFGDLSSCDEGTCKTGYCMKDCSSDDDCSGEGAQCQGGVCVIIRGVCEDGECACTDDWEGSGCLSEKTDWVPIILAIVGGCCYVLCCGILFFCFLRRRAINQLEKQ